VPKTIEDYLRLGYPFDVVPAEEGGYLIRYPDLPGCFTQIEAGEDIAAAAEEILQGWIAVALEDGDAIPLPNRSQRASGRFLLRTTRTMHADLVHEAAGEGVSLNAYVNTILAARHRRSVGTQRFSNVIPFNRVGRVNSNAAGTSGVDDREFDAFEVDEERRTETQPVLAV
jgi:predicted RNase H-like HicB family nuclease